MKYIIGVDAGSQSSKVLIFDLEGNIVAEDKVGLMPMCLPSPGVVEHPDDDWWDSICAASKKTMTKFKGNKDDIIGVGLCTIRFCRAYLKGDGTLAQPAISWMDLRLSKSYEHLNPEVKYLSASSGYITHRLTGNFKDTAANYQGMWPMDTDKWEWLPDGEEFDSYGMKREMLPDLVMPGDILGMITAEAAEATGMPQGIPVVATANDKAVEALGVGCTGETTALISLGTYIAAMMQGKENRKGTVNFWTNFACMPHSYLYESNGIRRGMWTVSWFKKVLGDAFEKMCQENGISGEEMLSLEAKTVPAGSDGLMTVLDWLAPTDKLYKKGMMIGFDGRHSRAHMYRSILEAIAMTMKSRSDEMCQELGIKLTELIISGGGSNSDLFMQIFADVFDVPTKRNVVNGAAGLGSAICAAVALGAYDNFDTAVEKMVKIQAEFQPNQKNTELYEKFNKIYSDICNHTDAILEKTHELFD